MKVIDDARGLRWMGPYVSSVSVERSIDIFYSGGHIMAYPIRAQQIYNIVLIHPSRSDVVESWTSTGPRKHMDDFYSSWSPTVRRLLALNEDEEIPEWNLRIHKPLKTWVEGSVALMGDACHPTLPYVAQGAAQAVEDAGVLAVVLSMCAKKEHSASAVVSRILMDV
jgi:salicylate hydroxylase